MDKKMYQQLQKDLARAVKEKNIEKIAEIRQILNISDVQAKYFDKGLTGYPTVDRPWEKYFDKKFDESDIPNKSIYQVALDANKQNMDNIALDMRVSKNDFSQGIKMSYKEFFKRIGKSADASHVIGIKKDEIIPIILPNVPEARILVYSDSILGSVSYPISPLLPTNQLEQLIQENEIKNLFVFDMFYEKYKSALKNTNLENIILLDGSESLPASIQKLKRFKDFVTGSKKELYSSEKRIIPWHEYISYAKDNKDKLEPFYEDNHTTAIIGTSGTTGTSKGVCLTDKNINTVAMSYKDGKLFEGSFMDALLPSIGYGISMLHYQTVAGKYVYLIPELLTTRFPEALAKLKPDNFPGGPVHYINLRASDEFKNGKLPKFQNLVSGGASLPKDVEYALNGVDEGYVEEGINEDIIVRQGYGLSENVAMGTYSLRGSYKFGSIGITMPYITIGIFKPDTDEELTYNEPGEICITGPSVMKEYLNNPEETDKVIKIHKDGQRWVHTKDIGYMDEDGHIFHTERIKNIFMRTGFNVHPAKIAEFINTIPFVKNCTVIGYDHASEQCVPIAFIELNDDMIVGKTDEELQELLQKICYENLEETSVPYGYVFVDELPINVGGKIDQIEIKKESGIDLINNPKIKKRIYFKD